MRGGDGVAVGGGWFHAVAGIELTLAPADSYGFTSQAAVLVQAVHRVLSLLALQKRDESTALVRDQTNTGDVTIGIEEAPEMRKKM